MNISMLLLLLLCLQVNSLHFLESDTSLQVNQSLSLDLLFVSKKLKANLCIGTPPQCFNVGLSLGHFFTWIADKLNEEAGLHKYDRTLSKTYVKQNDGALIISLDSNPVKGDHFGDSLWLSKAEAKSINLFAGIKTLIRTYDGVLALGYQTMRMESRYSLLDQLRDNKVITHRIFSVHIINEAKGKLTIGRFPPEIESDMKRYKSCSSEVKPSGYKSINRWAVNLKQLKLKYKQQESLFNVETSINFDYNKKHINVPMTMLKQLEDTIFKELFQKKQCQFAVRGDYHAFVCNASYEDDINCLKLVFPEWEMIVPKEKLFLYDEQTKEFEFIFANRKEDDERFVFGTSILQLFHMVYDTDNKRVGFYPTQNYLLSLNRQFPDNMYAIDLLEDILLKPSII